MCFPRTFFKIFAVFKSFQGGPECIRSHESSTFLSGSLSRIKERASRMEGYIWFESLAEIHFSSEKRAIWCNYILIFWETFWNRTAKLSKAKQRTDCNMGDSPLRKVRGDEPTLAFSSCSDACRSHWRVRIWLFTLESGSCEYGSWSVSQFQLVFAMELPVSYLYSKVAEWVQFMALSLFSSLFTARLPWFSKFLRLSPENIHISYLRRMG